MANTYEHKELQDSNNKLVSKITVAVKCMLKTPSVIVSGIVGQGYEQRPSSRPVSSEVCF